MSYLFVPTKYQLENGANQLIINCRHRLIVKISLEKTMVVETEDNNTTIYTTAYQPLQDQRFVSDPYGRIQSALLRMNLRPYQPFHLRGVQQVTVGVVPEVREHDVIPAPGDLPPRRVLYLLINEAESGGKFVLIQDGPPYQGNIILAELNDMVTDYAVDRIFCLGTLKPEGTSAEAIHFQQAFDLFFHTSRDLYESAQSYAQLGVHFGLSERLDVVAQTSFVPASVFVTADGAVRREWLAESIAFAAAPRLYWEVGQVNRRPAHIEPTPGDYTQIGFYDLAEWEAAAVIERLKLKITPFFPTSLLETLALSRYSPGADIIVPPGTLARHGRLLLIPLAPQTATSHGVLAHSPSVLAQSPLLAQSPVLRTKPASGIPTASGLPPPLLEFDRITVYNHRKYAGVTKDRVFRWFGDFNRSELIRLRQDKGY